MNKKYLPDKIRRSQKKKKYWRGRRDICVLCALPFENIGNRHIVLIGMKEERKSGKIFGTSFKIRSEVESIFNNNINKNVVCLTFSQLLCLLSSLHHFYERWQYPVSYSMMFMQNNFILIYVRIMYGGFCYLLCIRVYSWYVWCMLYVWPCVNIEYVRS